MANLSDGDIETRLEAENDARPIPPDDEAVEACEQMDCEYFQWYIDAIEPPAPDLPPVDCVDVVDWTRASVVRSNTDA